MDIEHRDNYGGDIEFLSCGFVVSTTPQDVIEENARDRCIYDGILKKGVTKEGKITDKAWEHVAEDLALLEERYLRELTRVFGITFRMEGHDSDGDLLGSCWVDLNKHPEALKFICYNANDIATEPYTEPHEIDGVNQSAIYKGLHPVTRHAVDVNFSFIDITEEDLELLEEVVEMPIKKAIKKLHKHCGLEREK